MSRVKYDIKKVPRELLEEYVNQHLVLNNCRDINLNGVTSEVGRRVVKAAEVPLRTRAEVDADIAKAMRAYREQWLCPTTYNSTFNYGDKKDIYLGDVVNPLIDEETSDCD